VTLCPYKKEEKMERRTILVFALVLMVIVMGISVLLYFTNAIPRDKWVMNASPFVEISSAPTVMKAIDLTGDGEDELLIVTEGDFLVVDEEGNILFQQAAPEAVTMGDFNGDGADDVVLASRGVVRAYTGTGELIWEQTLSDLGELSRANSFDIDGDGRREIALGTRDGEVFCLDDDGSFLWKYTFPPSYPSEFAYIRGLDDVPLRDRVLVAAATYAGNIALLSSDGTALVEDTFEEEIRRLRAYDLNRDGKAEIIIGGSEGTIWLLGFEDDTATLLWDDFIAARVTEVKDAQLDGDPATTEFLVGDKDGRVTAFDYKGHRLFVTSLGDKVVEFTPVDLNGDGRDEVVAGTEAGKLFLLEPENGDILAQVKAKGGLGKLETGDFAEGSEFLAGTTSGVYHFRIKHIFAPWWYNPLTAGFLACLIIAAIALALPRVLRPAPRLVYTAEEMSLEGLRTRRKMLLEQLAELHRLKQEGELPPESYLEEVRGLREQLAAVEEKMLAMGASLKPQIMKCPNCGAPLELGTDRCEYCGQVII